MRAVLQQEGIPFVEEQAREISVIPVVRDAQGAPDTGSAARAWSDVWKGLDLEHTLTPIELQLLKPVIHADTLQVRSTVAVRQSASSPASTARPTSSSR